VPSTPCEVEIHLLLDEHYPPRLAMKLVEAGVDAQAVVGREDLRGASDVSVLRTARDERRAVVTEDVSTFGAAMAAVPDHAGVIFCHSKRFARTRDGEAALTRALLAFVHKPPLGLAGRPFVWWLER